MSQGHERRVRRLAARRGLTLRKMEAPDWEQREAPYHVVDALWNVAVGRSLRLGGGLTLDEAEEFIRERPIIDESHPLRRSATNALKEEKKP